MLIKHRKAVKAYLLDKSSRKEEFCFFIKGRYVLQVKRGVGCLVTIVHSAQLLVPNADSTEEGKEKETHLNSLLQAQYINFFPGKWQRMDKSHCLWAVCIWAPSTKEDQPWRYGYSCYFHVVSSNCNCESQYAERRKTDLQPWKCKV